MVDRLATDAGKSDSAACGTTSSAGCSGHRPHGGFGPFSFGFGGRHTICAMGLVKCPLSYFGSKYRLLPRLLPLFPRDCPALREWALGRGYDVHEFDVRYSNMRHGEHSLPDAECYITNAKAGLW